MAIVADKTKHFDNMGQMSIRELPGAIDYGTATLPIQQDQVGFADQIVSDAMALSEANNNREESESFIATRGLIGRWNLAEVMLRAWVEPVKWKGSEQFRSHLGVPLVAEQFYSIHSVVNQTLFGGYQVFRLDATSGTPLECAEAQQAILTAQMKTCGYKGVSLKTEMREVTFDGLFYGLGVAHYGWETVKQTVVKKVPRHRTNTVVINGYSIGIPQPTEDDEDDFVEVESVVEYNQPKFEHVPIRRWRYSPDLRRGDPRVAEWGGRLIYCNSYDLDRLRGSDGWKIPTRDELVKLTTPQMREQAETNPLETLGSNTGNPIFQQTTTPQKAYPENYSERQNHDPLGRKFEVFDYWTPYRHYVILNKQYVLLNETHNFKRVPFLGFVFRTAPDSAHGYGVAFWLTDFQRVAQGVINAFLDDMNLNLMGTYSTPAGTNNSGQAQWIFPGKIFKSDPGAEFKPLTRNAIDAKEPLTVIATMKEYAASISGAGPGTLGANPGKSGDMRTPGGVELISSGESVKLQDLVDVISEQVFIPYLQFCIEQSQKLKPSQIRAILSQELGTAFKATPLDVLNGTYRIEISAGTKLAARVAIDKSLGLLNTMIQAPGTVENLAVQAMKFNYVNMYRALLDAYGAPYRDQIIEPMTDEDKQRNAARLQQNQVQQKIQVEQAKGEVKKGIDNNAAENRMLVETGKHTLKEQGKGTDLQNDLALQKAQEASPEFQGFDRAAKGAFASMDKSALGQ